MKSFALSLAFCALLATSSLAAPAADEKDQRSLALFNVVNFQNTDCQAVANNAATGNTGKCFTSSECTSMGGVAQGNCAAGFGVCCVVTIAACGGTVTRNNTYVANAGFSTTSTTGVTVTATTACTYTVNYVNTDICQLRLDFQALTLPVIAGDGDVANAATDTLTVNGPTTPDPPVITGTNTGLHMYVETARSTTATTIVVNMIAGAAKRWNIRVSQIECTNTNKAPSNCVQYFTGTTGTLTSYNYLATGGVELTGQNMALCVRQGANNCRIQYTATTATSVGLGVANSDPAETTACIISQLVIPRVIGATAFGGFVCGGAFSTTDASTEDSAIVQNAPFRINYRRNTAAGVAAAQGFSLDYAQQGC